MRAATALLVILTLAVATPSAVAQAGDPNQTSTEVRVESLGEPVAPGASATMQLTVNYNYPAHGGPLTTEPTRIVLSVTGQPDWVQAAISPSEVEVPVDTVGTASGTSTAFANLTVEVAGDAPLDAMGAVRVLAEAQENPPLSPSQYETEAAVGTAPAAHPVNGTDEDASTTETSDAGEAEDNGVPAPGLAAILVALVLALATPRRHW